MKKTITFILSLVVVLVTGNFLYYGYQKWQTMITPINVHGTIVKKPKNVTNFSLTSSDGENFDDSKLLGQWSMLFFGYTRCPDICPTTLNTLSGMYKQLNSLPQNKKPRVIFVSIDPEHDTSNQANKYSKYFNNNFIGLSGKRNQINQLSKSLGVVAQKVDLKNSDGDEQAYVYDHSSTLYIINPKGQLQAILTAPHKSDNLATDYKNIVTKFG